MDNMMIQTAPSIGGGSFLTQFESLPQMMQVAQMMADSNMVPERFRGKQGDTLLALDMAARLNVNPLMVMQNVYVVKGNPSFSGQFAIMMLRNCPTYSQIRFEYLNGKDYTGGMRVVGVRADGEPDDVGTAITPDMKQKFGWGDMWNKMPEQMYKYRAASWFVRAYCPEVLLGFQTTDELEDMPDGPGMRNVTPKKRGIAGARVAKAETPAADDVAAPAAPEPSAAAGPMATPALDELKGVLAANGLAGWKTVYKTLEQAGFRHPEIGASLEEMEAFAADTLANKDVRRVLELNGIHFETGKENA